MKELTLQQLNEAAPGGILAQGVTTNDPDGVYMTNYRFGDKLLWVAKRGGINDWAIYIHWEENGLDYVLKHGDKVTSTENINKLVPCTPEAYSRYRF